jgi:hypothetical protein
MRACFLGQNVCALGFGVAVVQSPPVEQIRDRPPKDQELAPGTDWAPESALPAENLMVKELRRRLVAFS